MTVRQLMRALMELPEDATVYISSDPEGNSYGDLGEMLHFEHLNGNNVLIFPESNIRPEQI